MHMNIADRHSADGQARLLDRSHAQRSSDAPRAVTVPWYETTDRFNPDFDIADGLGVNVFHRDSGDVITAHILQRSGQLKLWGRFVPSSTSRPWVGRRPGKIRLKARRDRPLTSGGVCMTNTEVALECKTPQCTK
jgi:hypothetical protein